MDVRRSATLVVGGWWVGGSMSPRADIQINPNCCTLYCVLGCARIVDRSSRVKECPNFQGFSGFRYFMLHEKTNSERLRNVTHCKQREENPHRCRVSSSLMPHYVLMVLITLCQIKLCVTLENLRI